MTRSIPSIIVLSLMCFTISYGIVRFPDAGILDAAQNAVSSTDNQRITSTSMKMPSDGSELQQDKSPVSTALPAIQASSSELFVTQPTTDSVKDAADLKPENDAADNAANNVQENKKASDNKKKKSNGGGNKSKENKKAAEPENKESQLPKLDSEPEPPAEKSEEQKEDSFGPIGLPDEDQAAQDDSMPIETDQEPLPQLDKTESDIPSIFVEHNPPEAELGPISDTETVAQDDVSKPETTPDAQDSTEKFWDDYFNENDPSNNTASNNDNAQTNAAPAATQNQQPVTPEPSAIKTDPNAQEIPPSNRETKPANKDALTLPGLDEPQNANPNVNQPDTGTIPMETFQLDASAAQKGNYTAECRQEPYDPFGIHLPENVQITVRRLPPVENSIEPIYNNAQLDRFAL